MYLKHLPSCVRNFLASPARAGKKHLCMKLLTRLKKDLPPSEFLILGPGDVGSALVRRHTSRVEKVTWELTFSHLFVEEYGMLFLRAKTAEVER